MEADEQHFRDLARLAGERDDLISRLAHVRRHIDRTLASGQAGGTSVGNLADAAGLSRESVYQAIARHRSTTRADTTSTVATPEAPADARPRQAATDAS